MVNGYTDNLKNYFQIYFNQNFKCFSKIVLFMHIEYISIEYTYIDTFFKTFLNKIN